MVVEWVLCCCNTSASSFRLVGLYQRLSARLMDRGDGGLHSSFLGELGFPFLVWLSLWHGWPVLWQSFLFKSCMRWHIYCCNNKQYKDFLNYSVMFVSDCIQSILYKIINLYSDNTFKKIKHEKELEALPQKQLWKLNTNIFQLLDLKLFQWSKENEL